MNLLVWLNKRVKNFNRVNNYNLVFAKDTCPECGAECFVLRENGQIFGGVFVAHMLKQPVGFRAVIIYLNKDFVEMCYEHKAFDNGYFATARVANRNGAPSIILDVGKYEDIKHNYLIEAFGPVPDYVNVN